MFDAQRLHIGSIQDGTRRPASLLTHADVVAALHRCKYDPASAEASLVALARRRESKYSSASSSSEVRTVDATGGADSAEGTGVAKVPEGSAPAGKSATTLSSNTLCDGPPGGKDDVGGNRWEDWSEEDRATFLAQLGDKVRGLLVRWLASAICCNGYLLNIDLLVNGNLVTSVCEPPIITPHPGPLLCSTRTCMMWRKSFRRRVTPT